jgi:hypothetical protein
MRQAKTFLRGDGIHRHIVRFRGEFSIRKRKGAADDESAWNGGVRPKAAAAQPMKKPWRWRAAQRDGQNAQAAPPGVRQGGCC